VGGLAVSSKPHLGFTAGGLHLPDGLARPR